MCVYMFCHIFFFNDTATTEIYTLSLHDALPIYHPASLFHIQQRGYIREGYWADLAIVEPSRPWALTKDVILSKCGWSPLEGSSFEWKVKATLCNGVLVYREGEVESSNIGKQLYFA